MKYSLSKSLNWPSTLNVEYTFNKEEHVLTNQSVFPVGPQVMNKSRQWLIPDAVHKVTKSKRIKAHGTDLWQNIPVKSFV